MSVSATIRGRFGRSSTFQGGPEVGPGDALTSVNGEGVAAPQSAIARIRKGERQIEKHTPRWRELWAHVDGEQFVELNAVDNSLFDLETREGGAKPRWRSRLTRNRMTKAIASECAVLTSRFPVYEATPINQDPEKVNAARTSEKVLLHLRDRLRLRRVVYQVVFNAAVTGDGFAWPFWNASVGTPIISEPSADQRVAGAPAQVDTGLREGEIGVAVLRQEQVGWEPGVEFDDSRWYFVRLTRSVEDVMKTPGYCGPKELKADAVEHAIGGRDQPVDGQLCFLYHYLERPSAEYAQGRWIQIVGGKVAFPIDNYPSKHDRPVIHRMPWLERGSRRDRSMGIAEQAIDIQRSINRIVNQLIMWRCLVLNPQLVAPEGSIPPGVELSEEPGFVLEYRGAQRPEWREVPEIPVSLFKELEQAYADLDYVISGGAQAVVPNLDSGAAYEAVNEREQSFRSMVLSNLADFYRSMGEHLLYLVAERYTEQRILEVEGRFGTETIRDFLGTTLDGCLAGVRVNEASIEPRTRAAQEAKIMAFADKQWITPQQAMHALATGSADTVIDRFELDIARVWRQIQNLLRLQADPALAQITDPSSLLPEAKPYDNHAVAISEIEAWMKTPDFERTHPTIQAAAENWRAMHEQELGAEQQQQMEATAAAGAAAGTANAARPGSPGLEPSRPSIANEAAALAGAGS